jgi:hypothetical protein
MDGKTRRGVSKDIRGHACRMRVGIGQLGGYCTKTAVDMEPQVSGTIWGNIGSV